MAAMNPIAMGILTGAASGFVMSGFNPLGAVVGGAVGGLAGSEQQKAEMATQKAAKTEQENQNKAQNALAQDEYAKRQQARGIGTGGAATQTGTALTPQAGGISVDLLG